MKSLVLCPVNDNGDNDCKYYYCDSSYVDSIVSNSERKSSITIKITLTVMICNWYVIMIVVLDKDDDYSDDYRCVEYKILGMLGTFYAEYFS